MADVRSDDCSLVDFLNLAQKVSKCRREVHFYLQPLTRVQIPSTFQLEEVKEKLRKLPGGPQTPLTVHLRQEIDRLNIIVQLTTTTLNNLRLAIAGTLRLCSVKHILLSCMSIARSAWHIRVRYRLLHWYKALTVFAAPPKCRRRH